MQMGDCKANMLHRLETHLRSDCVRMASAISLPPPSAPGRRYSNIIPTLNRHAVFMT